jgi:hypothetical protein
MFDHDRPGRSTGPRSPDGKQRSSGNAITHGCCSAKLLVSGERQEDFDALRDYWFAEFAAHVPGSQDPLAAESLIEELALNHWLLKRAQRNYIAVEYELSATEPMHWLPADERKLHLMLRYKAAAERSFDRSLRAVEKFVKDRLSTLAAIARAPEPARENPMYSERAINLLSRKSQQAPPRSAATSSAPAAFPLADLASRTPRQEIASDETPG